MPFYLQIYFGNRKTEFDFSEYSSVSVGGGSKNNIIVPELVGNQQFFFALDENGVTINSNMTFVLSGQTTKQGVLTPRDTCLLSQTPLVAAVLYKKIKDSSTIVDFSKILSVKIGRSPENNICLRSNRVARRQAKVEYQYLSGKYVLTDLESANGTYLNNERIHTAVLKNGDIISIAGYRLIFNNGLLFFRNVGNDLVVNVDPTSNLLPEKDYPYFAKPQREREELPSEEVAIQTSATIAEHGGVNMAQLLASGGASLGMSIFMGPMALMGLFGPATSGVMSHFAKKKRDKEKAEYVKKYKLYLKEQKKKIKKIAEQQSRIMNHEHPTLSECLEIAQNMQDRLWERTIWDDDFMSLRLGLGEQDFCAQIKCDEFEKNALMQDELILAPGKIKKEFAKVSNTPVRTDFKENPIIGIVGDRYTALQTAKNVIVQATTHHSYDELKIITIFSEKEEEEWSWVRWMPHVWDDTKAERYIAKTRSEATKLCKAFEEVLKQRERELREDEHRSKGMKLPYLLFVLADKTFVENETIMRFIVKNDPRMGIGTLMLFNNKNNLPSMDKIMIANVNQGTGELYCTDNAGKKEKFAPDHVTIKDLDSFARNLAPIRLKILSEEGKLPNCVTFLQGYQVKKAEELDLIGRWSEGLTYKTMAVPIGARSNGDPFYFDVHEKITYSPHGIVAGMSGSGKSEMVQTWILSMALHFSPSDVSFVLIDFKGTGLILPFANMPHLAGTISDLDTNIHRNLIALENELSRRKALLDKYGVNNINSYLKLYREGRADEPLSILTVVIDEFAEFKVQFPDFMSAVDSIFRIGRTLGVFALLLAQKPSGVISAQMEPNTGYRWCLKVASGADSKEMIGRPDASKINVPGRGYVKIGDDNVYELVQSYWSGAPYDPNATSQVRTSVRISTIDLDGSRQKCENYDKTVGFKAKVNEIDAIVKHLANFVEQNNIPKARAIWTEKLGENIPLEELLEKNIGFNGEEWESKGGDLAPIIGLIDDPVAQSQYPLALNLTESGHTAIYGAPGTGKTTALQTLVISLAHSYSPEEVNIYIMDFGGWSMNILRELPHIGGIANDNEEEKIEKLARLLTKELEDRRRKFAIEGANNISMYRQATGEVLPEIVLVLDNFVPVREMYPEFEPFFLSFTQQGGSYGMYFVVSTNTTMSLGFKIAQNIKMAIALQMVEKSDYAAIVGKTDGLEPDRVDGRGLVKGERPLEFQTALPIGAPSASERVGRLRELSATMNRRWIGKRPQPIPIMPEIIGINDISVEKYKIPIGLKTADITPVYLDLSENHFFLISGTKESGKSNLLKVIAKKFLGFTDATITVYDSEQLSMTTLKELTNNYICKASAFDEYIESLMPMLKERREQYGQDKYSYFSPLAIIIDDLYQCLENASEGTIQKLEAICRLGKGLQVNIFVGGQHEDIIKLNLGEIFTVGLVKNGTNVLLGGNFNTHGVFDSGMSYSEKETEVGKKEGYLLSRGSTTRFKAIYAE